MQFTIAYRDSVGRYEVHTAGCRHLLTGKVEAMVTYEGESARAIAAEYDTQDGIFGTKVSPCAKATG